MAETSESYKRHGEHQMIEYATRMRKRGDEYEAALKAIASQENIEAARDIAEHALMGEEWRVVPWADHGKPLNETAP